MQQWEFPHAQNTEKKTMRGRGELLLHDYDAYYINGFDISFSEWMESKTRLVSQVLHVKCRAWCQNWLDFSKVSQVVPSVVAYEIQHNVCNVMWCDVMECNVM